ncbi:snake venom vascular endothelial growth factor toxin HF [Triplophysa rosa]|uniref:Placenta growth factor-like n=1 Tax=Triplophysa rosa TaxID=992332 RepID=A0A9W7TMF1_TRIRA|nr:snake venom vascular endothelial growth factor toxin HF [Triplophysa rosa]XP_057208556.1 snake venom vascular endothelial growth factor toxin HF [Triplophysa rosa]KAI7799484.1 putative placenta growth factor-like [Triplophysa rosa]
MNRSVGVSQLAVFLFYILLVQVSIIRGNSHSKVMLFHEAWGRSLCSAMQRLVEVDQEYPGGVEHIYSPGCVPLLRCSGCCNDEKLACYPSRTHNITIQLLRITPAHRSREYVLLSFQEHHTCECRPRRHRWRTQPKMRGTGRGQRRRRRRRRRGGGGGGRTAH